MENSNTHIADADYFDTVQRGNTNHFSLLSLSPCSAPGFVCVFACVSLSLSLSDWDWVDWVVRNCFGNWKLVSEPFFVITKDV